MYCYDWGEDGFDLYGSWNTGSTYQTLEFGIYPCASQIIAIDGTVHGGGDECNWDFDEHRDYFGPAVNVISLSNRGTFKQDKYGALRVDHTSTLQN